MSVEGICDNRSINYCGKSLNTNETPLGQNQFTENKVINDCIFNDSLTRNDDVLEKVNENVDTNFNDMLHINVHCVIANDAIVGCIMQPNI